MPPLTEWAQDERNCTNCYKSALRFTIRNCSGCSLTPYCSKECQREHWKAHKPQCLTNREANRQIAKATEDGLLINGFSPLQVDHKFRMWIMAVRPVLDRYTVAAMDFARYPDRCFTHIVVISVKCNLTRSTVRATTPSDQAKQFLVERADLYDFNEMPKELSNTRRQALREIPGSRKLREDGLAYGLASILIRFLNFERASELVHLRLHAKFDPSHEPKIVDWAAELKERICSGNIL